MFKTPTIGPDGPTTLLAAVAGVQAPWIEALCPEATVLFRQTDARRQLWFAVGAQFALHPERIEFSLRPEALVEWLESARAIDIVRKAGLGAPPGWRRSLGRLGPFALKEPANYLRMFAILVEGGAGADILRHATRVTESLIEVLATLDPELRQPALVTALLRDVGGAKDESRRWMWRLRRLRISAPAAAQAIEEAVRNGAAPIHLLDEEGPGAAVPLPPPPWIGTALLRPLSTTEALRHAARRFHNCLGRCVYHVRRGSEYFYEYEGDPAMIVELDFDAPYGWIVEDVKLVNNRRPSPEALQTLGTELAGAANVFFSSRVGRARGFFDQDDEEN